LIKTDSKTPTKLEKERAKGDELPTTTLARKISPSLSLKNDMKNIEKPQSYHILLQKHVKP